jgi:hypothetical protein
VAEFLDEIQTKVLEVLLLAIHSYLYSFEIYIPSNSRNLLHISTVQTLCTLKEKGGKPGRKSINTPFPIVKEIHTETSSLRTLMPRNLNEIVRPGIGMQWAN